ncbi:MAG: antibiotic biosynthesis monooxygenase family protein [Bacteroidota bacterium]
MYKYGLHSSLQAQAGKGDALAAILLRAAELVKTAPGCYLYLVSREAATPDAVWVTEVWESKEAHDVSLSAPEVRALIGEAMPILESMPRGGQQLEVLGGAW